MAHLLAIVAMAVYPAWHEAAHHDAEDHDHECAVTLFSRGAADAAAAPMRLPAVRLKCIEVLRLEQAREVFLARVEGRIRERAPPIAAV